MKYIPLLLIGAVLYFYNVIKYINAYHRKEIRFKDDIIREAEINKRSTYIQITSIVTLIAGLAVKYFF